jgi:hydroxymethylbilane synthase
MSGPLRIGTRRSRLALWQTEWVAARLAERHPGLAVELVPVETLGDRDKATALAGLGRAGVFTKEIEDALLADRCDVAVHSYKDLATRLPAGLVLAAVPERADPRDAVISRSGLPLDRLPAGARVGTSSLRRRAQLLVRRPDLQLTNLRGNVPTRLRAAGIRLDEGKTPTGPPLDATLLALAGLARLGFAEHATEVLDPLEFLPAPAQGALALEVRADDRRARELVGALDHGPTRVATTAERTFLEVLEGGCHVPLGALARLVGDEVRLTGTVCALDGSREVRGDARGTDPREVGARLAAELVDRGASAIIAAVQAALDAEGGE